MPTNTAKLVDVVTLLETPTNENGYFYIVKSKAGRHYVSSLGGKAAHGLRNGTKLNLYLTNPAKEISAYKLERI